ncbi:hypothetical protein W97_08289 [Coniosporium apollinis CBS 100218]|uniref:RGS domain-containing protein n=1 Tax=Coniosporium apollinis (strain CBS 100218) TaxID=1168221 RepID=R7Z4U6_CONA1|nr:uncharacterized protein W97_08289 [Coniosporium apollinis CBS 100218]EON69103.1 hypothetical protein W97_08289 [Coniosporium apollinis CBS 100218]
MERDKAMNSQRFQFHDYTSFRDDFSLDDVTITKEILQDEQRRPLSPIESVSQRSQRSMASGTSMNKFADFFGNDVFQIVLHNPTTAHQMLKFAQARLCAENLEFLDKVDRYTELLNELSKTLSDIHRNFISPNAPNQINLAQTVVKDLRMNMKTGIQTTLPKLESILTEAQDNIESLVYTDIYPRFVRHQVTISAAKALAGDRRKYQGLGDCFCLTNPSKADNPIVCASDGFVKVTGYQRSEIVPRNCRFLQGTHTDRAPVRRLKAAIAGREESVELLLNYKKSGEPFWNLLYVTPLFNPDGNVAFFLGGQINCSTTIHNYSDVLRILSHSDDVAEETDEVPAMAPTSTVKKSFFKAFRSHSSTKAATLGEAGMEQRVVNQIGKVNLKQQMQMFYTAYSKYLVLSYDSLQIRFYSAGIIDVLDPNNLAGQELVGTDAFKFLAHHATTVSRDYKSQVKASLRAGQPVSLYLHLSTRRSAVFRGDERFVTHWTPLKDEHAIVKFIVLTMSSTVSQ